MTDANRRIGIPERSSKQLVRQDPNSTVQFEQAVISEDSPDSLARLA